MARRLAAIMFTDIAGYTALSQADESRALQLLREQKALVRPILELHHGRQVKSMGDGLLIEFPNALDAVECAVDLQRHVHERNAREGAEPLRLRVGIHLGDVQRLGSDIVGDAVNIASRIEPLAEPGGVCLSEPVYFQVRNKVPYQLEKLGPKNLKGVQEPLDIYRVVLPWSAARGPSAGHAFPRIAVLPLANISPDPKDEYFADGLTEELISVLSQIRGLRVISRTSVNQYKGTAKPIAQIASELGADSVLEGSVRKAGDQLRIAVQLIDTRTDEHRWAKTYDRRLENVFAIQAEVAERTAEALKVELLKSEGKVIQEKPTSNLAAYESYLRGIKAFQQATSQLTAQTDREVVKYFEEAIQEDPAFSAAYSYLAMHFVVVGGMTRPYQEVFPRARELVAKALELNPKSSDAHTARGNLAMQADLDWKRAEEEFQQAIALNPSSSTARAWYAYLLGVLQRFDEAQVQNLAAMELDPLWTYPRRQLIGNYSHLGDLETVIALSEKLMERFPDQRDGRDLLAWGYALAGRRADAVKLVEPLAGASDLQSRGLRAAVLALLGEPEEMRTMLMDFERGRRAEYLSLTVRASGYAMCGDTEKALLLLEREYRDGESALWNVYQDRQFDSIRKDPRFQALLRALNLPMTLARPLWSPRSQPQT
jgi:TolB-like protein